MKLLFIHDTYYAQNDTSNNTSNNAPNNAQSITYAFGAFPYAFWQDRYLPFFNQITVVGRKKEFTDDIAKNHDKLDIASGQNITFRLFDNMNSPLNLIKMGKDHFNDLAVLIHDHDGIVIHGPSELGLMASMIAQFQKKPYLVNMSGCAFDNMWHHGGIIGKIYAPIKFLRARYMAHHAAAISYVTKDFLQNRYPAKKSTRENGLTIHASNVEMRGADIDTLKAIYKQRVARIHHQFDTADRPLRIGMIGNFSNHLKGLDTALHALKKVDQFYSDFELHLLGQGNAERWDAMIHHQDLHGRVIFCGTLPGGQAVMDWLDQIDIYIQPSRHEGLPRAVIEAMSRACPVIASNAGGIPELLPSHFIHDKGDAAALSALILEMVQDPELQKNAAKANLKRSQSYTREKLEPRRFALIKKYISLIQAAKQAPCDPKKAQTSIKTKKKKAK